MRRHKQQTLIATIVSICLLLNSSAIYAATAHTGADHEGIGRILDGIEAEQADTTALITETSIFKSIGMSIALSLAQCEEQEDCKVVQAGEIEQLLNTLDERINGLIIRQEQGAGDFTEVLTAYVDQREKYLQYQDKLEEIIGVTADSDEVTGDDAFADETGGEGAEKQVDLSIFNDADENLGSDEFLIEDVPLEDESLKDDFNPEDL